MEKQYIISESELIDLLTTYHYINYLNTKGIDNWWNIANQEEYIKEFKLFENLAKNDLKYYIEAI